MNSSLASVSLERQSASLAGSDEVSSAFLRRVISFCLRALTRACISATTFSSTAVTCCLVCGARRREDLAEFLLDDLGDDAPHGPRPEDLLGLALELRLGQRAP